MFERAARGYAWPAFGGEAELRSLSVHCGKRHDYRKDPMAIQGYEAVMEKALERWSAASCGLPADFMTESHFRRCIGRLDWTSSPGYPWMQRATSNGQLFKAVDGVPSEDKVQEFWLIVQDRIRERTCDPIRLFIKAEPHKLSKIEEGRYRLISSVSVVDQLIDHMLFGDFNDALVDNWMEVPSKIGWAPVWGGWRAMPKEGWMALDKSGWDWTVNAWLVEMTMDLRQRLCEKGPHWEQWRELMEWRYRCLFVAPLFVTSGGILMRQRSPGVMKSGCVNTISDNSIMQDLLHLRVCFEMGVAPGRLLSMGDDTLQEKVENEKEYLRVMGEYCKVKQVVHAVEFAGNRFVRGKVEPLYKGKHAYILLHLDPQVLQMVADSYLLNYHRSSYRDLMEDLFGRMGANVVSRSKRDLIYDGY